MTYPSKQTSRLRKVPVLWIAATAILLLAPLALASTQAPWPPSATHPQGGACGPGPSGFAQGKLRADWEGRAHGPEGGCQEAFL